MTNYPGFFIIIIEIEVFQVLKQLFYSLMITSKAQLMIFIMWQKIVISLRRITFNLIKKSQTPEENEKKIYPDHYT
jgi:hypothetical protein